MVRSIIWICIHHTESTATASAAQCCNANAAFHWKWMYLWCTEMQWRCRCERGVSSVCIRGRELVWKNIYHGPKQESSQGVLNGPACLEKPFSKWMPLSIRVSDRNLPRAMPAGNKIASLHALFLSMSSLFSEFKKITVKRLQIFLGLSYAERVKGGSWI